MDEASGAGRARSQLPGWARAGLPGLSAARGILYRDSDTPLQGGGVQRREERLRREQLEDSLLFLRNQHKETLQQLHSEAERLQRENRELSFRLIMCRCDQRTPSTAGAPAEKAECSSESLRVLGLQEEVQQLKQALAEEQHRNRRIQQLLESHLQASGDRQPHELNQTTKTGPSGLLSSHKWAPNTRASLSHPGPAERRRCENIKFPALKPRLPGGVAERQRRRHAVQKRLSRIGLPPLNSLT